MSATDDKLADRARERVRALMAAGFTRPEAVGLVAAWGPPRAQAQATQPKRKPGQDEVPEGIDPRIASLVDPVLAVLRDVAEGNGVEGAVLPTRRALALTMLDYPDRDWLPVARNYRAWQLGGRCKRPHRDVLRGYRAQLGMADAVARPTGPAPESPRRRERSALEEAEAA